MEHLKKLFVNQQIERNIEAATRSVFNTIKLLKDIESLDDPQTIRLLHEFEVKVSILKNMVYGTERSHQTQAGSSNPVALGSSQYAAKGK